MSGGDLHKHISRYRSHGCVVLIALSLLVVLAGCGLGAFGIRSGAVAPVQANGRIGPIQLVAFELCTSRWPANPCTTGTRSYEIWLLVDWRWFGVGNPRSYPLMIMPLQE
jgi:hypothetical protein